MLHTALLTGLDLIAVSHRLETSFKIYIRHLMGWLLPIPKDNKGMLGIFGRRVEIILYECGGQVYMPISFPVGQFVNRVAFSIFR